MEQGTLFEIILAANYLDIKVASITQEPDYHSPSIFLYLSKAPLELSITQVSSHVYQFQISLTTVYVGPLGALLQGTCQQDQGWATFYSVKL